jgi:CRP-like cAMP-binding protein
MPSEPATFNTADLVRATAIFRELSDEQLTAIWSRAKVLSLIRGAVLVRQNTLSDSVFVVVSGRFEVWVEGQDQPINEIGVGEPIGEIGFFSGAPRTATIVAARDSVVLELDRPSFNTVAREVPAIYQTLLSALARRVAGNSARVDHSARLPRASASRGHAQRQRPGARPCQPARAFPWPERGRPESVGLAQCARERERARCLSM